VYATAALQASFLIQQMLPVAVNVLRVHTHRKIKLLVPAVVRARIALLMHRNVCNAHLVCLHPIPLCLVPTALLVSTATLLQQQHAGSAAVAHTVFLVGQRVSDVAPVHLPPTHHHRVCLALLVPTAPVGKPRVLPVCLAVFQMALFLVPIVRLVR